MIFRRIIAAPVLIGWVCCLMLMVPVSGSAEDTGQDHAGHTPVIQADLAKALSRVDQRPGEAFNIITLGFSDDEDPSHALGRPDAAKCFSALIMAVMPLCSF